jgi:acyl-CoA reductase-like NAD-dependent aldehyde dehydrogenase
MARRALIEVEERMLIGGNFVDSESGSTIADFNPATQELLTNIPSASAADLEHAVESATEGFERWSNMPGRERGQILWRLADLLDAHGSELAHLESRDNGRPIRETSAQAGIVPKWYRYFAGLADKLQGSTIPVDGPYLNYTLRVPIGVCAAITPWNHPQLIVAKKVAAALAAGNAVIVKPSELAPLSVLSLGRLGIEAGLPPGVLNIVTGAGDVGATLSRHERIARIDVTGSTATGVAVATAAAKTMKRLGFELGGKAANIVFADADIERTLRGVLFSGFVAQGQSCVAGSRVLVEHSAAAEFANRIAERAKAIRIGDPLDQETQMGPMISGKAANRVREMVRKAEQQGARVLAGGDHPAKLPHHLATDNYLQPTVIWTDDPTVEIACEEVFGPVIVVMPFRTEDEAISIANSVPYGLGGAVWSRDVSLSHRVAGRLRAGIAWINDYHRIDPASPWGGFGLSGYGRENGINAMEAYTELKSIWVPLAESPLDWYETSDARRLN